MKFDFRSTFQWWTLCKVLSYLHLKQERWLIFVPGPACWLSCQCCQCRAGGPWESNGAVWCAQPWAQPCAHRERDWSQPCHTAQQPAAPANLTLTSSIYSSPPFLLSFLQSGFVQTAPVLCLETRFPFQQLLCHHWAYLLSPHCTEAA